MNLINKTLIDLLMNASETMKEDIASALREYRNELQHQKSIATQYKDEAGYLAGQQTKYAEIARTAVYRALRIFKAKAEETAKQMEEQLRKHLHEPVNAEFQQKLMMISQFGLKPERMEVEDLISLADGNQTALSALKAVLEKVQSPYHLNFHATAAYEQDIENVRSISRNAFFIPLEFHPEGAEIFNGQQFLYTYPSGSQIGHTLSGTDILLRSTEFGTTLANIAALKDIWTKDCSYSLADQAGEIETEAQEEMNARLQAEGMEPEPIANPESGVSLDNSSAEGIRIAKELGKQNSAGAQTLQKAMDIYLK